MTRRIALVALLLMPALTACGASQSTTASRRETRTTPASETPDRAPARPASPRDLRADASFGDLVSAARLQDDRRDQDSAAACLLSREREGYRLEADLAVAVRPLPAPAGDLDARLARDRSPIHLLTRFGSYGRAVDGLALVAINTTLPPVDRAALGLFLTDRGLYARRSDVEHGERDASRTAWVLEHVAWEEIELVAVTAEASVPLSSLYELLAALPSALAGRVTLATPLDEGTRLPERPASAGESADAYCPDGLPPLDDDAPYGDPDPARLRAALEPLRGEAALCVGTSVAAGAAGGRVTMQIRVDPEGRAIAACASADSIGDPLLRACLARAVRELVFDRSDGFVDLALPLALEPGEQHRQTAVCNGGREP